MEFDRGLRDPNWISNCRCTICRYGGKWTWVHERKESYRRARTKRPHTLCLPPGFGSFSQWRFGPFIGRSRRDWSFRHKVLLKITRTINILDHDKLRKSICSDLGWCISSTRENLPHLGDDSFHVCALLPDVPNHITLTLLCMRMGKIGEDIRRARPGAPKIAFNASRTRSHDNRLGYRIS
jgi:hypothetical protein